MKLILPERNNSPDIQIIAKNDTHYDSMVNDDVFMTSINQRNIQANGLMNLNNSDLTKAGNNAAQNGKVLVKADSKYKDWINRKWRPLMGWMYMAVCVCDFILFPIAWSIFQAVSKGSVTTPWQPLTLQGAGLFHISMATILGIAAYGRTREKIEGISENHTED